MSVSINTNSEYFSSADITIEPSRNLSVGSTYKLRLNRLEDYFLIKGIKPTLYEKEITIEEKDVDSYLLSLDQLNDNDYTAMDTAILNNIESRMEDKSPFFLNYTKYDMTIIKNLFSYDDFLKAGKKSYYVSHTEPELLGTYLLTYYTDTFSRNLLYRVFQTKITDEKFGTYTAVFAGSAEKIIKYKDGTIFLDSSHLSDSTISCYTSLDSFETECIQSKKSSYTVEKK